MVHFIIRVYLASKAVDKWVLGGVEAPPNFWHFYVKCLTHSAQHTTAYGMQVWQTQQSPDHCFD